MAMYFHSMQKLRALLAFIIFC